jgi:predicted Zn-dependent protease
MAKRVNTKFLIGLTAVVGGLAVAGFALAIYYARHHHTVAYYTKLADAAEARGDWEAAADATGNAIARQRSNTALYVQLGGYLERLVSKDPVYLGKANKAYRAALEIDPGYTPAIDHLLSAYVAEMRMGVSSASFYNDLKSIADKGIAADSANPHYQAYSHIAALQQWIYGSTQSNPLLEKEMKALADLSDKHPEEADAAFYASEAQLKRAAELASNGQTQPANALLDQIAARHAAAIKALPQDPAVQLRAYQVFSQLAALDPRVERRADWQQQADRSIQSAYAIAKPSDDDFDNIQSQYANRLRAKNAPADQIEKALTGWTTARPHDQRAKIEMASYLATVPGRRPQAVKLLETPVQQDPDLRAYAALNARNWERGRLIALNTYRLEDANSAVPADRQALLAPIDADLERIASLGFGEDANLLKLRGKVQMLRGKPVEAITNFEKARTLLGTAIDPDLWLQLRHAYEVTGQTGTEQRLMEDLLNRAPGAVGVRVQLTQLYLSTGQPDKAAEQLRILKGTQVTDPAIKEQIQRLDVQVLASGNPEDARKQFASLPETRREDRLFKARMAGDLNESAEAIRLYRLVLHDNPADPEAVAGALSVLLRDKNVAQAQQVVNDAAKAQPENRQWSILRDQLAANTPEAIRKLQNEFAVQTSDPMLRALRMAQLAMERGQWSQAATQLDEAQKLKPDDNRVLIARLQWFVLQRKFDQAAPLLDRAAAANADQMSGLALRTRFALTRNDAAAALRYGNELVGKHGEFSLNWLLLARAQQMAGNFRDAVSSCDAALQRQSNNLEALKLKAACLELLGLYEDEKTVIVQAARVAPEDVTLRDLALNWELHHGDPDRVISSCEQILKQEPENAAVYAALGQACEATAQSKYRGDAAAAKRLLERARDVLSQGMSKFAGTPDTLRFFAPLSLALDSLGDKAGAEDLLKKFVALPQEQDRPDASRELARFYERHGRLDDAERAWRDAYARSGQSVQSELELAQFLVRHGQHDPALAILDSGPTQYASDPRVQNQKIETLLGARRTDEAMKAVDQAYGSTPSAPAALYYRGLIDLTKGNAQSAVDNLSAARNKDPQNAVIRIWLARAMLAQNHRNDAAAELVEVLRRNPLRDDARMLLLEAYSGGTDPRWDDFDQVVQEAENNPVLAADPAWHQLHARGLAQRNQFPQAKAQLDAARKIAPDSFALWDEYVNLLIHAKEWQHVLDETDKQLTAGHKDAAIYGKRGIARVGLGDKATAVREFDTGLSAALAAGNAAAIADLLRTIAETIGPDEALARVGSFPDGVGRNLLVLEFLGLKRDYAGIIRIAETALSDSGLRPDQKVNILRTQSSAYIALSQADKANAQWDKARRAMDQLLSLQPDDVPTLNNAGYLLCQILNDPQSAKPYSTRAYDLTMRADAQPEIIDTHGWILTLCGGRDADQGLLILRKLVDSNPGFIKGRYHLVEAYIRQRRFEQASDQLKIVQEQIKALQDKHQEIDSELATGVAKAAEELGQKSGRATADKVP